MSDISILLDEQNQLKFDVEVQGVSSSSIQPRFIIEADNMDLSFNGKFDNNQVTVDLPILAKALQTQQYNCRLEFVVEGEKFFRPMEATLDAVMPTRIRAGIANNNVSIPRQTTNEVAVGAAILATVEQPVTEEVIEEDNSEEQLAAIGQLLIDRSEDENTESKLSLDAFINIANKMGMPLTQETLFDLAQSGDLENIIKDVNQDEIIFKGKGEVDINANMNVDKAKDVVKGMAKRNAKKGIHK